MDVAHGDFFASYGALVESGELITIFLGGGTRGEGRMILGTLFRHIYQG